MSLFLITCVAAQPPIPYEGDFLGFSYGCRPGRSPHDALDALTVGLVRSKVHWVLSIDIRGFFDPAS
jgi:retron-type reverse transcriptase